MNEIAFVAYDAPAKDVIRKVREVLTEPAHWAKGTNKRIDAATGVVSMCLAYAVLMVTGTTAREKEAQIALDSVSEALRLDSSNRLVNFNDSNLTTHAKLLERLDRVLLAEPNA